MQGSMTLGNLNTDRRCIGMDASTLLIRVNLPPKERSLDKGTNLFHYYPTADC